MPDGFQIEEAATPGGAVVIRVGGKMDAKSTPTLVKHCREVRGRRQSLILNLSNVTFIASSGVGGLLSMMEDFSAEGLKLRLAEISSSVDSVIRLLNLDQFLTVDSTEADAVAAVEA